MLIKDPNEDKGKAAGAELEKLPEPKKEEDEEKRYSKDGRLSQKSGVNPFNNEQDSTARLGMCLLVDAE